MNPALELILIAVRSGLDMLDEGVIPTALHVIRAELDAYTRNHESAAEAAARRRAVCDSYPSHADFLAGKRHQ